MILLNRKVDIGVTREDKALAKEMVPDYTPDIARLEKYQTQKVFVYDELLSDRRGHHAISDIVRDKVVGFTTQKFNFLLYSPDGTALPVADEDGHQIKGEILWVRPSSFLLLDRLYKNGVVFERRRVFILDPYRISGMIDNGSFTEDGHMLPDSLMGKKQWLSDEMTFHQSAWMYFPKPDYWEYILRRRPEIFNRVPVFKPKAEKTWLGEGYTKFQNPPE